MQVFTVKLLHNLSITNLMPMPVISICITMTVQVLLLFFTDFFGKLNFLYINSAYVYVHIMLRIVTVWSQFICSWYIFESFISLTLLDYWAFC